MKEELKVACLQTELSWESPSENLKAIDAWFDKVEPGSVDLIVLPEMFTTGFTMNASAVTESMDGASVGWMREQAKKKRCVVTGSVIISENNRFYNRLIWMREDGTYETYDKRHLFRMAGEHDTFTMGNKELIVELKGWRIRPLVCYDLRFPVWSRNKNNYDCLIYVANWPAVRSFPWKQLLIARAIENLSFVIGVNRLGRDETGLEYDGGSAILNFKGETIRSLPAGEAGWLLSVFKSNELNDFRKDFPAHMDADLFTIHKDE